MFSAITFEAVALQLDPDHRSDHCRAFKGTWRGGQCLQRYEFQQRSIGFDSRQFCEARGGSYQIKRTARGRRTNCVGLRSKQGLDHYPMAEVQNADVYLDVERSCLNIDFSRKDCTVADSAEVNEWFNYTHALPLGSTPYNIVVEGILDGIANLKRNRKGELLRRNINANLYHKMIKENLNSCQQACLTKCATATIIDYDHDIGSGPHPYSTEYLYSNRRGVCTEFSRLNKDIADLTGTPVQMRGSLQGKHSYNIYKIRNRWYYGEPQNKGCNFFHTKRTLREYKKLDKSYQGRWTSIKALQSFRRRRP